jgi:hypothetical protein
MALLFLYRTFDYCYICNLNRRLTLEILKRYLEAGNPFCRSISFQKNFQLYLPIIFLYSASLDNRYFPTNIHRGKKLRPRFKAGINFFLDSLC